MLEFQVFSDTHQKHGHLNLTYSDVLIFAGDHHCTKELDLVLFLTWFELQPSKYKIFVPGNHDIFCEENPERTKELMELHNIHYLVDEEVIIEGHKFYGTPYTPEFCNWAFMEEEEDLEKRYAKIPDDTEVLITHGPPRDILDWCPGGNVGSTALNTAVYRVQPHYHIFGHIHESSGNKIIGKTEFMNVSVLDGHYYPNSRPIQRGTLT